MTRKELVMAYILRQMTQLEEEHIALRNRIRYRRIDQTDCIELMLLQERQLALKDFSANVMSILKIDIPDELDGLYDDCFDER